MVTTHKIEVLNKSSITTIDLIFMLLSKGINLIIPEPECQFFYTWASEEKESEYPINPLTMNTCLLMALVSIVSYDKWKRTIV